MQKISIHSIAAKYFLSTSMLIILPLCIFFFIAQKISFNTTMEQKRESDLNTLNTFSESIAISMDSVLSVGKLAASDPGVWRIYRNPSRRPGNPGKPPTRASTTARASANIQAAAAWCAPFP